MLMGAIIVVAIWAGIVIFQLHHRPLPSFYAQEPKGQRLLLQPSDVPNLMPEAIIRFASKAAVAAYTFDFVNYKTEIESARLYFTPAGWSDYQSSVSKTIAGITQNKLFVSAVVNGPPVISNQGERTGTYSWRVQVPFLVTYQSSQNAEQKNFTVLVTLVRVSTNINPLGMGIDQFVMV